MTEQQPGRPVSAKVAAYQTMGQKWLETMGDARPARLDPTPKERSDEDEAALQELLAAFKAAGFKVKAAGAEIGITCDHSTAVALAEWLRAQPPAKRPRKR